MPAKLTDEQVEELQDAFNMFDKSKSGTITTEDVGPLMSALGQNMSAVSVCFFAWLLVCLACFGCVASESVSKHSGCVCCAGAGGPVSMSP